MGEEEEGGELGLQRSRTMSRATGAVEEKEVVEKKEEPTHGMRHNKSSFFRQPDEVALDAAKGTRNSMRRGKSFSVSLNASVSPVSPAFSSSSNGLGSEPIFSLVITLPPPTPPS